MNIAVICFTEHGAVLAERLSKGFSEREMTCRAWIKKKEAQIPDCRNVQVLTQSLREWTKEQFAAVDAMIFIGATGIAVRSIAPYVRSKKTDPAVIVVDEQGRHAISLLSGHIGGANALTLLVSEWIGAEPVITTATDLHGKFAVDAFAARRDLYIDSMPLAKEIAAALVEDKKVGICSAFPVLGTVPAELTQVENLYGVESDGHGGGEAELASSWVLHHLQEETGPSPTHFSGSEDSGAWNRLQEGNGSGVRSVH